MKCKEKLAITLSKEVMEALQDAAAKKGMTPNLLARILLFERFSQSGTKTESYTLTLPDWSEIKNYVEEKGLPSVEYFAINSMNYVMKKNALSAAQKRRIKEKYIKADPIDSKGLAQAAQG